MIAAFAGAFAVGSAHAGTFTVNTTTDSADPTPCVDQTAGCALRGAVIAANQAGGSSTITLPAGTYTLTLVNPGSSGISTVSNDATVGSIDVNADVTISGAGVGTTEVDGDRDRVFHVVTGHSLSISNLTIAQGADFDCNGGLGVYNSGTLTVTDVRIANNRASCGFGAGIANFGTLTVADSTFDDNFEASSGGGIYNGGAGTAAVTGTTFTQNSTEGFDVGFNVGGGGAIGNRGTMT
ncbi:MAG TPA: hypothetical protein VI408_10070, partial [Gaiellaceae bacterium]